MTEFPRWYAVHTCPQGEELADRNLRRLGYATFYPFHRVRRRRKRPNVNVYTVEWVNRPYFSRYIFVALRHKDESLYPVQEADGVSTVVYCAGEPLEIPHRVMDEIMARADDKGMVGTVDDVDRPRYQKGQRLMFAGNSPLSDLVAEVSVDEGKQIKVWLELLGSRREVSVSPRAVAKIA